ncbi:MAG: diacylglycerol kinase [Pseudomonadota bacterium]
MAKPGDTGLTRVIKAARYSWQGFRAAWNHESAFRQECTLGLIMLPLAFLVGQSMFQVALLIAVLAVVLITELLNSAVEAVVDRVGHEHHDLAGQAKDMGSAAVFVSLALVVTVWTMVVIKNFFMT